jgi:Fe-S-cluster containining protein
MTIEHPYEQPLYEGLYRQVRGSAQSLNSETLDALMTRIFAAIDHTVQALKKQDPPAIPTACKAGCDYCCAVQVQVLAPEILHLANYLKHHRSETEFQELANRVVDLDNKIHGMSAQKRARLSLPCPLLENGRCSAYEVRPIACRAENSSDVGSCTAAIGPDAVQETVPAYTHQVAVCRQASRALVTGIEDTGLATSPLELVSALRLVLSDEDPFAAWLRGDPVFADAKTVDSSAK